MRKILITGGTGSLGTALIKRLASYPITRYGAEYDITVLSRDAHKQVRLAREYPQVNFVLADVCDEHAVRDACEGKDIVIHAAAMKILSWGEAHTEELVRVNVEGTRNVARACNSANVPKCLLISTDKAPDPINAYGKSKAIAESIWTNTKSRRSLFCAVRYGNVLNSNGSVWNVWNEQLKAGKPITVRVPEATRFILTVDQAVSIVFSVLSVMGTGNTGERNVIYIPAMLPAFSVHDLARAMVPDESQWSMEPLLPGEKVAEVLLGTEEHAYQVSTDLWQLTKSTRMNHADRGKFCSATTGRISGEQVMKAMKGG